MDRRLLTTLTTFVAVFTSTATLDTDIIKFSAPDNKTADIPNLKINDTVYGAIRQQWNDQAVGGFLVAFSKRLQSKISDVDQLKTFESCSEVAKEVGQYAECMRILWEPQWEIDEKNTENTKVVGSFVQSASGRVKRKSLKEAQVESLNEDNLHLQNESDPSLSKFLTKLFLPIARPNRTIAESYMNSVNKAGVEESVDDQTDQADSTDFDSLFSEDFTKVPYSHQFVQPIDELEMVLNEFFNLHKTFDQTNGTQISQDIMHKFTDVIRATSRLGLQDPNDDNVKSVLSPNLFSITEDKQPAKDKILSPTLLSFRNDSNSILSIPQILHSAKGFDADQQVWMDFIMDASGSKDILKGVRKLKNRKQLRSKRQVAPVIKLTSKNSLNGSRAQLLQNSTEVAKILHSLQQNLTAHQLATMKDVGYAFMDRMQIEKVYGPDSEERRKVLQFDADQFLRLTTTEKDKLLLAEILAFGDKQKRKKRAARVLNPIVFTALRGLRLESPVILSPVLLSESTLAPTILGPIILCPILFYAIILSPRILSPIILSPLAFLPVILTPVVLGPRILSPVVLFPVVLCPFLLSPIIVAPSAVAGIVLCPRFLTPYILSPVDTAGVLLSPRILSPLVKTKVTNTVVVLSPNVLSRRKRDWRSRRSNRSNPFRT